MAQVIKNNILIVISNPVWIGLKGLNHRRGVWGNVQRMWMMRTILIEKTCFCHFHSSCRSVVLRSYNPLQYAQFNSIRFWDINAAIHSHLRISTGKADGNDSSSSFPACIRVGKSTRDKKMTWIPTVRNEMTWKNELRRFVSKSNMLSKNNNNNNGVALTFYFLCTFHPPANSPSLSANLYLEEERRRPIT